MADVLVSARVTKVGSGLAVLIPAKSAREGGLAAGDPIDVVIHRGEDSPVGLLADVPYTPFIRRREGLWRDRL